MVVVSGTRIQARKWRALSLLRASMKAARQAEAAPGFIGGALLKDRKRAYWTVTVWQDEPSLQAYRDDGAHAGMMKQIRDVATAFVSARWNSDHEIVPGWKEVHDNLRATGRWLSFEGEAPDKVPAPISTTFMMTMRPRS